MLKQFLVLGFVVFLSLTYTSLPETGRIAVIFAFLSGVTLGSMIAIVMEAITKK